MYGDMLIVMHDGSLRPLSDLKGKERIMSPSGLPTRLTSINQKESKVYAITPRFGSEIFVTDEQLLPLRCILDGGKMAVDISLKNFMQQDSHFQSMCRLVCKAIEFEEKELPIKAYEAGVALMEEEIPSKKLSKFTNADKELILPPKYLCCDRFQRLDMLQGFIDAGSMWNSETKTHTLKFDSSLIAAGLVRLCRGMGICARAGVSRNKYDKAWMNTVTVFLGGVDCPVSELYSQPMHSFGEWFSINEVSKAKTCYSFTLEEDEKFPNLFLNQDNFMLHT